MKINNNNKIKRAFGLAEVLIGLAITAGVLITITSVALSAYKQVKDNELADQVNGIMLMSVEYFKTPISGVDPQSNLGKALTAIQAMPNDSFKVFKMTSDVDANAASFKVEEITVESNKTNLDIKTCDSNSDFKVIFSTTSKLKTLLCNKILITRKLNGDFIMTSSIAYTNFSRGEMVTTKIMGYRQSL